LDTFELFSNTELVQIIAEEIKTYTEYWQKMSTSAIHLNPRLFISAES
jgi:hypothetical protein